jgi:hypothetical protein
MRATRTPLHLLGLPADPGAAARFMDWFTDLLSDHRGNRARE